MANLLYAACRCAIRGFFRVMGGFESVHEERVPQEGALIVAPNHVSFADPPAVGCATQRPLCFMAKRQLFLPGMGGILRMLGAFPVERGVVDLAAIRKAQALLREGKAVLIFPEGTRGDGKSLLEPNQGVALLAKLTSAPVMPVAVVGTQRFLPRGAKIPRRTKLAVVWGEPFRYESVAKGLDERSARQKFGAELMRRIQALALERGLELEFEATAQADDRSIAR